jgi:predicted ester cyclase
VRRFYAGIRAGLPDFRITVEDCFGAGDRVVVRWHATATHTGTFRGMPPTGAKVSLDGIAIYRLANGKAVERWVQVNMLDMIEQIRAAASSTARPMDAAQLKAFGARYTAAWCSQNAASVAAFFSEAGSLQINGGAPSVGRAAITAAAQGFMTAFPDMVVTMDGVDLEGDRARYRWTLNGTNTGPGGTGKAVKISGYEEWRFGPDGLVAESKGHFDEADYKRQLSADPTRPAAR